MTTLVIHPHDPTTLFLSDIYSDKDWTIITTNVSKSFIKKQILSHDRIIMMGHGTERGLLGFGRFIIDSSWVWLLRQKECICIWCYADQFVQEYNIKGPFYTGMIISEIDEVYYLALRNIYVKDIDDSNKLFVKSIKESIDSPTIYEEVKKSYFSVKNPVIIFNQENIFKS